MCGVCVKFYPQILRSPLNLALNPNRLRGIFSGMPKLRAAMLPFFSIRAVIIFAGIGVARRT
jgi:hypothetical protein